MVQRKILISILLVTLFVYPASAQNRRSALLSSYDRARRVLHAGIEALGGREALRAIQASRVAYSGQLYANYQSPSPVPPYLALRIEAQVLLDQEGRRAFNEQKIIWPDFTNWTRTVTSGNDGFVLDLNARTVTPAANPSPASLLRLYRLLPNHLLELALARAATLRWVGEENYQGSRHNVISVALADGTLLTLYFAARTNLLSKYEILIDDFAAGDTEIENIYPGYRQAGRLQVPTGFLQRIAGELVTELRYEAVEFNNQPEQSLFEVPAGFRRAPAPAAPTAATVTEVADDVYLIRNLAGRNFNVLFIAFNDYVLVVEAPLSSEASQAAIALIKATVPGKPIRYIVPTHYHDDHTGGIRGYIAEGATIVTTPGNRQFFARVGSARRTIAPDALTRNPRAVAIEVIAGQRRIFQDAAHRVELYDVGPTPHAREIIIAYLPQERIIFQGDLFAITPAGEVEPARAGTVIFAEKIRELGLEVEQIIGVHGSRAGTMEDLRLALERRRQSPGIR